MLMSMVLLVPAWLFRALQEIISVVHIGWATIDLRVRELAATAVAELTVPQIAEDAECDDGATVRERRGRGCALVLVPFCVWMHACMDAGGRPLPCLMCTLTMRHGQGK